MRIEKIYEPEDWYKVKAQLKLMCFEFPQFLHDYDKMCKSIEMKIKDLAEINIQIKRHDSLWHRQLKDNKTNEINETVRTFTKILLIATLAKR